MTGSSWAWIRVVIVVAILLVILIPLIVDVRDDDDKQTVASTDGVCSAIPVAAEVLPSVVTIQVQGAGGAGTGSGEFINSDGYLLTNNHVISSAASGGTVTVILSSGEEKAAKIIGRDQLTDLAVLKADVSGAQSKPIHFDTENDLVIGQPVFSVGAPLGLSNTVSAGIVSSLGRTIRVPSDGGRTALLVSAIQTDASINPGNSGGTLANCAGDLVGVPTAGATASDSVGGQVAGSIGLGFAIPAATAMTIANEIIADGSATHSYVGLSVVSVGGVASPSTARGLYVTAVDPAGPAAKAGIQVGDVITSINGESARSADDIESLTLTRRAGDSVSITFNRAGASHTASVVVAAQPSQ